MVISASARAGMVCEEPWEVFSGGRPDHVDGYPSTLPAWDVLIRARRLVGTAYRLFDFNCDHFVAIAHGQQARSPQLAATIVIGLFVLLMHGAARR